jgi:PIN domain nuclease of toxin-antitoxin system
MKYLLDTHALIWFLDDDKQLPIDIKNIICSDEADIYLSIASFWEMAIKIARGKLKLSQPLANLLDTLEDQSIALLPIQPAHILKLLDLPFEHNDPFDRIMIAQCLQDEIAFISNEELFLRYGVNRVW